MGIEEFNQLYTKEKYAGISCISATPIASLHWQWLTAILPILFVDNMLIANCITILVEWVRPITSAKTHIELSSDRHMSLSLREYEKKNIDNAYTDNALYGMRKMNGVNYQLTGGFCGELSSVKQENAYSAPSLFLLYRSLASNGRGLIFAHRRCHCPVESSSKAILFPFCVSHSFVSAINLLPVGKCPYLGSLDESEGGLKDIYPFRYRERLSDCGETYRKKLL